ncbi:DNA-binding bromodomain-containing protein [Striga asiatica]|uniref:DNA-binding bromodomain-containing protein n=1 Tax=Striga asiatica TaxID=4170 RepID=A0A5A7Q4Y6_STRAF|nr:DNA-binding bromodomain-containing protein [Striga asiatica]
MFMNKPQGDALAAKVDDAPTPSWGTWEELILAFAVNRHGTASWDSIASELRKRTSEPNLSYTPNICRSKYLDLKRRFVVAPNRDSDATAGGGDGKSGGDESAAPLLEELRKLRVAELRREVERYDLNIEYCFVMESAGGGGEGIDKDRLSVNESNSTDPAAEKSKTGEKESEPAGTGVDEVGRDQADQEPAELTPEPDRKSGRADSCNGSSNSIEKSDRRAKEEPATDSAESGGGGEAAKESSDVQSTASRSRKEGGGDTVQRGSTGSDGREHEDHKLSAQSQPLVDFIQSVLAHNLGSIFQRRLRSQETSKYQKLILQHMDLETVETKLRRGFYSGSRAEFFRDILLLVNNAIVFFPNNSLESNAALEIRALVAKEISRETPKPESGKQISLQNLSKNVESTDPSNPSKLKTRLSGSLKMCRQRSSVADEKDYTRKRTMDNRFSSATTPANTRRNSKNNNNSDNTNQSNSNSSNTKSDSKKRGATNFLNRMNKGSNSGDLLDALKNTPLTSGEGSGKGGEKKVQVTRRSTAEERLAKEKGIPGKRNVGRPPKRAAVVAAPPAAAAGKRGREKIENEQKKRIRKI